MAKYIVYFSEAVRVPVGPFESKEDAEKFCADLTFSEIKELLPPERFLEKKELLERMGSRPYYCS